MTENYSIFDNIVKDENSLTALFCNYLRFEQFRNVFLHLLKISDELKEKINYEDFNIQYSIGEHGRPDLTIINNDIAIYVEIKTNQFRGFTDNQPTGYIKSLLKAKVEHKKLVFLIPENYHYIDNINVKIKETIDNEKIEIIIIYWEHIIDIITNNDLHREDKLFKEYLDFLEYYFKPQKIIFMPNELSNVFNVDLANGLDKILFLVNDVSSPFKKKYPKSFKKTKDTSFYEYGFYLTNNKVNVLFFGFWFSSWKQNGSPICICLCDEETEGNKEMFQLIAKNNNLTTGEILNEQLDEDESLFCAFIDKEIINKVDNLNQITKILKDFTQNWNFK